MKWHFAVLFLFSSSLIWSQKVAVSNVEISGNYYLVSLEKDDQMYSLSISRDGKLLREVSTPNFNPSYIFNQLKKTRCLEEDSTKENCPIGDIGITEDKLKEKSTKLFIDLLYTYANEAEGKGQKIAEIALSKKVPVYYNVELKKLPNSNKKRDSNKNVTSFEYGGETYNVSSKDVTLRPIRKWLVFKDTLAVVEETMIAESCQLVFENGFIASIIVSGTVEGRKVNFSSQYSIGVTTRSNIRAFSQIALFDELNNTSGYIKLNEVIEYGRVNDVYTRDYSPMDGKVVLSENSTNATLYKSPSSKLFRLNVFSDFVGLNEENPNGLVQIEVDKRINIWTKRVNKVSWFTFLTPYFEWSKIEEHNRSLTFSEGNGEYYTSPLEVYRYSMIESGILLNVFEGDGAVFGCQVNLLPALTFTQVKDTLQSSTGTNEYVDERINSFIIGGELKLTFSPEKTWGMAISTRPFYYSTLNAGIPYKSPEEDMTSVSLNEPNRWLNDLSLLITLRLGSDSDNLFFARLGMVHELANFNNNFAQVQLGYSMYLKTASKK